MPKSCIICSAVASKDILVQYYSACQSSTLYCSKVCRVKDWKKQLKQICKLLNVGHGDMHVRTDDHINGSNVFKEGFERGESIFDAGTKRFFKAL
jgi:hypothetical protein